MIHCLATRRDRVVRVDHKTFGKSVLTVKVGTLQMKKLVQNHLIADPMGNVGGEKAPFVAATELLRCKKEKTDLLVGPVACPLLDIYVTWKHQTHLAPRDDKSTYWDWIGDTSDSSLWRCSTSHHPLYPTVPEERRFGFAEGFSSISVAGSSVAGDSPSTGMPYRFATTGSTELEREIVERGSLPVVGSVDVNGKGDSRQVGRIIRLLEFANDPHLGLFQLCCREWVLSDGFSVYNFRLQTVESSAGERALFPVPTLTSAADSRPPRWALFVSSSSFRGLESLEMPKYLVFTRCRQGDSCLSAFPFASLGFESASSADRSGP